MWNHNEPIWNQLNPKKSAETTRTYENIILGLISSGENTNKELMNETNLSKDTIFRITKWLESSIKIYKVGSN